MSHAMVVHNPGEAKAMRWEEIHVGTPQPHEVRIRHTAIGVNFIDVYFRQGLYKVPRLPFVPGMEAAGVVEAVGDDVRDIRVGDRVAYAGGPLGAYATERLIPADRLVLLPAGLEDRNAAAMMLKGMTAQYLLRRTYPVQEGDVVLWHAAAGGVGLIACQWAKLLGATVIGTVGTEEKAKLVAGFGCDYPIVYTKEDFVSRVKEITNGEGVHVVYDSVGASTFMKSLDCLRPLGTMVSFGQTSGPVAPIDVRILSEKGSLFLTRPTLFTYTEKREELLATAQDLFSVASGGRVRIEIQKTYSLSDAQSAHRDLESRQTVGSLVLLPER